MRNKLAALFLLIVIFSVSEYFLFPRSSEQYDRQAIAPLLVPQTVGDFRVVERWNLAADGNHPDEIGARYRNGAGVEADFDIWLDSRKQHNNISCFLIRGYPMLTESLHKGRMGEMGAVFDTALFRDDEGLTLVASTECYASGCTERRIQGLDYLYVPGFVNLGVSAVPISIHLREKAVPSSSQDPQVLNQRLLGELSRFTAEIDLRPLFPKTDLTQTSQSRERKMESEPSNSVAHVATP